MGEGISAIVMRERWEGLQFGELLDNALLMRYVAMYGRQLCIYMRWFLQVVYIFVGHLANQWIGRCG